MGKAHWKKSIFVRLMKYISNLPIAPQHAGKINLIPSLLSISKMVILVQQKRHLQTTPKPALAFVALRHVLGSSRRNPRIQREDGLSTRMGEGFWQFSCPILHSNILGIVWFLIDRSSLLRKIPDRQLMSENINFNSFSNISGLAHDPWR